MSISKLACLFYLANDQKYPPLQRLMPPGRPGQAPREKKNFYPMALAPAPAPVAANQRRVNAGRATAGLAWPGGGSAGRSGRRAARARAVGRGRSPWPTRWRLGRPRRCGCGVAGQGAATAPARWYCRPRQRLSACRPGRQRVPCPVDECETMRSSAERMPPGRRGPRRGRAAPRRSVRDLRP
jgi:hypothetical protein